MLERLKSAVPASDVVKAGENGPDLAASRIISVTTGAIAERPKDAAALRVQALEYFDSLGWMQNGLVSAARKRIDDTLSHSAELAKDSPVFAAGDDLAAIRQQLEEGARELERRAKALDDQAKELAAERAKFEEEKSAFAKAQADAKKKGGKDKDESESK